MKTRDTVFGWPCPDIGFGSSSNINETGESFELRVNSRKMVEEGAVGVMCRKAVNKHRLEVDGDDLELN